MKKIAMILMLVCAMGFMSCATTKLPTVPQLKPLVKVAAIIAQIQGKITPEQAAQYIAAVDSIQGENLDIATIGHLVAQGLLASGKLKPDQVYVIQLILDALNTTGAVVVNPQPSPTPVPVITPTPVVAVQ